MPPPLPPATTPDSSVRSQLPLPAGWIWLALPTDAAPGKGNILKDPWRVSLKYNCYWPAQWSGISCDGHIPSGSTSWDTQILAAMNGQPATEMMCAAPKAQPRLEVGSSMRQLSDWPPKCPRHWPSRWTAREFAPEALQPTVITEHPRHTAIAPPAIDHAALMAQLMPVTECMLVGTWKVTNARTVSLMRAIQSLNVTLHAGGNPPHPPE